MASDAYELATPPQDKDARYLWLEHAAGRILFEDVREYARERIDPKLSPDVRGSVEKGIDDALYGLMMVIDGVSGFLKNEKHEVTLDVIVRLVERGSQKEVDSVELRHGDGMCMGFHGWRENDYGEDPIASRRPGE